MKSHQASALRLSLLAGLLCCAAAGHSHGQNLKADYQLQKTYSSSVGTVPDLTVLADPMQVTFTSANVNGTTQEVLSINANTTGLAGTSGVQTNTAGAGILPTKYSIVLEAEFDLTSTGILATKVLDFKNLSSDAGLYITAATGDLEFINDSGLLVAASATQTVTSGAYTQLALTRDASGEVVVYENGVQALSFADTSGLATLGDATSTGNAFVTLFKDDGMGVGGTVVNESAQGALARLQIYDDALTADQVAALAVPEPSVWALAISGFLVLGLWLRRQRSALAGQSR